MRRTGGDGGGRRIGGRRTGRRGRVADPRRLEGTARRRLRRFRQGSMLAVALTGLLLLVWGAPAEPAESPQEPPVPEADPGADLPPAPADPMEAARQAAETIRDLVFGFWAFLPKLVIALVLLLAAGLMVRLVRPLLRRAFGRWEQADAAAALVGVGVWLLALGAALSVIAGDVRVLVGSIGLFGLALSWALQTPIEGFSAWLLNSFKGYYRVGDRIAVGDVFGDVYEIDFLTTTVWEAGGPEKPVRGAQATGTLVTFPNAELLRSSVVNLTRDFPYVWDEVEVGIALRSDVAYAMTTFERAAARIMGEVTAEAAERYRALLRRAGLAFDVVPEPKVFAAPAEAWLDLTVRYLVPARQRRRWASRLVLALYEEMEKPEHAGRIVPATPQAEVRLTGGDTGPRDVAAAKPAA